MEALGGASRISKTKVSRICQGLDEQVKAFLGRPLDHARYPYVYLDVTYLHGRLGQNMQVVSRSVVVAIGFSEATMAKIPEPEEALELTDADPSAQPAESTS